MLDLPKHLATYLIIDISLFIASGFICSEFMDLNSYAESEPELDN